jgi:crotonobetainyl-CoA:carnitine CoA-transferase CaiB-like acyl-CoA transferase
MPLKGTRILDLSHVLAGPYATHVLAQLGAEVIKIEQPGIGDSMRELSARPEMMGLSPNFVGANAAKHSLTLDLTTDEGRQVLERLVKTADIFVENFRPGKMTKLGFSPERLAALNPNIVCCSISAWGQTGSLSSQGGFDHVMQAATGMMMMQGDDPEAPPIKVGFPVIDMATGMQAALAVMAGLMRRRGGFKGPIDIDVSMADAALFLMAPMAVQHLFGGPVPMRVGNRGFVASPGSSLFRTADGWLSTGANTLGLFDAMCEVLNHPEYATAPEYLKIRPDAPGAMLFKLGTEKLLAELETAFVGRISSQWETELLAAGVPAATVRTVPEYLDDVYPETGGVTLQNQTGNGISGAVFGAGFRWNGSPVGQSQAAPQLGANNDEILKDLGYTEVEISAMRRHKVTN